MEQKEKGYDLHITDLTQKNTTLEGKNKILLEQYQQTLSIKNKFFK